jgi:hypothetical protein
MPLTSYRICWLPDRGADAGQPCLWRHPNLFLEEVAMDILCVALILAFFAVAAAFVRGCHKLEEE